MKLHTSAEEPNLARRCMAALVYLIVATYPLLAADNSITSSLSDMMIETRTSTGPVLTHHEVLSISGTLPMLGVGSFYHYPSKQHPIDALGISLGQSFSLIGESTALPTHGELAAVRNSLLESQQLLVEANSLALRRALLESQLASPDGKTNQTGMQTEVTELDGQLKTVKTNLLNALAQFRTNASKPGIVVANWAQESKRSGGFSAVPILSAGGSKSGRRQGAVILGGIRVSQLFVGDEFKSLFLNLTSTDSESFSKAGITTYLLQAKEVLSFNELDVEGAFSASLKLKKDYFAGSAGGAAILKDIESLRIALQAAYASQLNNFSSIGEMKWKKEPVSFRLTNSRLDLTNLEPNLTNDGWRTVHAVVTHGEKLFDLWNSKKKKRPPAILPELASFETSSNLAAVTSNVLVSIQNKIAALNAHLETDMGYLFNDNLYKGLQELTCTVAHLNDHLNMHPPNFGVIQAIATRQQDCFALILSELGTNSWSDIERLGFKERAILEAINKVKPVFKQFPIPRSRHP